ncbi:unnamed protein product [Phytophthora fragariaefolia]|uniref:Unnamed protein product n=1 Tax=Phytophthora fragariaefolia TaxID=1490495 RepID=A0A9W6U4F4_9STRA|nr:unnamed protein product [Phytophthora fragariaefolia]
MDMQEAEEFWNRFLEGSRLGTEESIGRDQERARVVPDIFGFKMRLIPVWLTRWGRHRKFEKWDLLTETVREASTGAHNGVLEAMTRYRMGLFPLTAETEPKLRVTDFILKMWRLGSMDRRCCNGSNTLTTGSAVGFFDGGSRGNPGPGGSGSVIVDVGAEAASARPRWAATTALGKSTTTNNEAEFIGLHRVLAHAVARDITGIFIVGVSAMILRMMRNRTEPKSVKMRHWYRICRRLADICRVAGWSHHYRRHNKMADWLANVAMDTSRSVMVELAEDWRRECMETYSSG